MDGQGDRQAAFTAYQQSVALFRETGDQWALAHPLCDLALRTWDEGRLHEAIGLIKGHLADFRRLGSRGAVPMVLGYLSFMAAEIGDFDTATRAAQEKLALETSRGLPIDRAYGLHSIASLNLVQGRVALARTQFEEAWTLAQESQNGEFKSDLLGRLGQVALYEARLDEASDRLAESRQAGPYHPVREARALFGLGQAATRRGDVSAGLALMRESLAVCQEIRPLIPGRLEGLAQLYLRLQQPNRGARLLGAADRLRAAMGCPVFPVDQPDYEQTLAGLQASLGPDAWAGAWAAGQAMSTAESVAYALAA